jgi:hypothetical protein
VYNIPPGYNLIIYSLVFFPGSFLYERAIADQLIAGEYDSGYEMNYLGGLHYDTHPWKKKNLYLNGLLYLMVGSSSPGRIGMVPRFLIKPLLKPGVVEFGEKHTAGIRMAIAFKFFVNRITTKLHAKA